MAKSTNNRNNNPLKQWLPVLIVLAASIVVVAVLFDYNPFENGPEKTTNLSVTDTTKVDIKQQPTLEEPETEKLSMMPEEQRIPDTSNTLITSSLAPEPNLPPNPQTTDLIDEAMTILNNNPDRIIEARQILNDALQMTTNKKQQNTIKRKLAELSDKWLFSRTIFPQDKLCGTYKVEPGEQLRNIGRLFNVPYEALMEINKISDPSKLQAGQVIKIVHGPFHVIVDRSDFILDLYLQDTYVKSFEVGLGKEDMETPTGLWVVQQGGKLIKPRWTDPLSGRTYEPDDPDYPLGSRWIALDGLDGDALGRQGFAIHGTKDPNSIGTRSSQGCIRLHNGNVILVYKLLEEGVSKVRVIN